mmetsp:Transcript_43058/g.115327  ORF Transcript_43058/g.115327 Transcript_43058/m.115327 type:complete len:285 (-) Transcript_43058:344-1198(-)
MRRTKPSPIAGNTHAQARVMVHSLSSRSTTIPEMESTASIREVPCNSNVNSRASCASAPVCPSRDSAADNCIVTSCKSPESLLPRVVHSAKDRLTLPIWPKTSDSREAPDSQPASTSVSSSISRRVGSPRFPADASANRRGSRASPDLPRARQALQRRAAAFACAASKPSTKRQSLRAACQDERLNRTSARFACSAMCSSRSWSDELITSSKPSMCSIASVYVSSARSSLPSFKATFPSSLSGPQRSKKCSSQDTCVTHVGAGCGPKKHCHPPRGTTNASVLTA